MRLVQVLSTKSTFGSHTWLLSEHSQQDDEQQKLHINYKDKQRIHNSAARIIFESIIDTLRMIDKEAFFSVYIPAFAYIMTWYIFWKFN